MSPFPPQARRLLATLLDAVLICALCAALVIILGGRTRLIAAGVRVSLRSPANLLVVAAAAAILRVWLARTLPLLPLLPRGGIARLDAERERLSRPMPRGRSWRIYAAAAVLSSVVWILPHALHPRQVPDVGDPVFSAWRQARFAHQLANDPLHLFDGNIFHPTPLTLAYSDAAILQGLIGAPFVLAGADPLIVSNAIMLASFPIVALAFFVLGWRLTADPAAAFVSGVLGALATSRFEHYSHIEMQFTPFVPLAVVVLIDTILHPSRRRGALLGALVVGQWLAGMYLGLMLLFWLLPLGLMLALAWARPPFRPLAEAGAAAAVVIAAGFGLVSLPYLAAQKDHGGWGNRTIMEFSAEGTDYRRASPRLWTEARKRPERSPGERRLYPGLVTPALAAVALVPPATAGVAATLVAGAMAFDWSLGRRGLTYDDIQKRAPALTGMRAPARFSIFAVTSLLILAALGAARLLSSLGGRVPKAAVAAAIALAAVFVDLRPSFGLMAFWESPPPIYGAVDSSMVLAEFPISDDSNIAYMYFSTRHWARLINGYSGFFPESYLAFQERAKDFPSPSAIAAARAAGATHVTFNCRLEPRTWRCGPTVQLLDADPALERVAGGRWEGHETRLYRIR